MYVCIYIYIYIYTWIWCWRYLWHLVTMMRRNYILIVGGWYPHHLLSDPSVSQWVTILNVPSIVSVHQHQICFFTWRTMTPMKDDIVSLGNWIFNIFNKVKKYWRMGLYHPAFKCTIHWTLQAWFPLELLNQWLMAGSMSVCPTKLGNPQKNSDWSKRTVVWWWLCPSNCILYLGYIGLPIYRSMPLQP